MPINMERAVRLHRLAHACASFDSRPGQPTITLNRLRAIANAEQLDRLTTVQYDEVFAVEPEVAAVTFAKSTFAENGIDARVIEHFTTQPGSTDALACSPEKCSGSSPFLDAGDEMIVVQPTAILFALIQFILTEARKSHVADALTISFHNTVVKSVLQSFREMNIAVVSRENPDQSELRVRSTLRPFIHFSGYGDDSLLYSVTAADLETIATLEQRDPLAIWHFAHHTKDFLKRPTVNGSTLSFFHLYRGADHSYYLFDDIVPTFMPLGPYGSGELRPEAQRIRRQHLLASYSELLPEDSPHLYDSKHLPLADAVGPEIAQRLELEKEAAELSPKNLIERLVLRSEALIREGIVHRGSLANRTFHFTDEEAFAEELRGELADRYRITGTLRFLIEYVSARPPEGTEPLSLIRFDELMALAAQMIDFAGMSDALRSGRRVDVAPPSGRIGFRNGPYTAYSDSRSFDEITRVDAVRKRRRRDEELSADSIFAALDAGVTAEFEREQSTAPKILSGTDGHRAPRYLVLQLLTDRYQPTAPELKRAMGHLTKERGDLFNRKRRAADPRTRRSRCSCHEKTPDRARVQKHRARA